MKKILDLRSHSKKPLKSPYLQTVSVASALHRVSGPMKRNYLAVFAVTTGRHPQSHQAAIRTAVYRCIG